MAAIDTPVKSGLTPAEKGVLYAVLAHLTWGAMAVYFCFMIHISPMEIAVHRGLWSIPFAAVIIWWLGQYRDVWRAVLSKRNLAILTLTSAIIVFNWGFYVWSIEQGRTLESSLGYYINPLLNVVIGFTLLGERLTKPQVAAVGIAFLAVAVQTVAAGVFPWVALLLAGSFAAYGYMRKTMPIGPIQGFLVEAILLSVIGGAIVAWLAWHSKLSFGANATDTLLLISCGPMTALPLMWFAAAARRIRYSTLGLLQYIAPSGLFLTAILAFGEPLDGWRLATFVPIWLALAIYSLGAWRLDGRAR
jgi:chloramphenicol-sensitive protein RarD